MLVGISPLISPDSVATLHRMGHGAEIDNIILKKGITPA